MKRGRSSPDKKAHPAPSGPLLLASIEKAQRRGRGSRNDNPAPIPPLVTAVCPLPRDPIGQEINRDILEQQDAAYIEAIRLRMIAQGIPFEAAGTAGDIGPSIRVPIFDRLGPSPRTPVRQVNLIPRLERGETLRSYVEKFHKEVIQMRVFDEKETLDNFRRNLWADRLFRSFAKHPTKTYQEAYNRALEQVDIEDQLRIKVRHDEARLASHPKKETPKPVPVKRFQNQPPNKSTYRPLPVPSYNERYPTRRYPPRRSPPKVAPLKEVA
ncbi:hypothetical protein LWI28_024396 [Acer negundo]|uniref:Retrotransposon gag domain-containing protein n=1 Tax=Acer negundo TaxID=4023 RepID=A0AAD5NH39_ACENE|nr:hypothetical protein LWI28_024396 [Acer negundo]